MTLYIRDLPAGTEQIVDFVDDPGEATPAWRLAVSSSKKAKKVSKKKAKK